MLQLQDPSQQLQRIAGVIGASASVVSITVANMLQLFKVGLNRIFLQQTALAERYCNRSCPSVLLFLFYLLN